MHKLVSQCNLHYFCSLFLLKQLASIVAHGTVKCGLFSIR